MRHLSSYALTLALAGALGVASAQSARQTSEISSRDGCGKYTIISTRGTGEMQGPSAGFGGMIQTTLSTVEGGEEYDTVYPADASQMGTAGTEDILRQVSSTLSECPDHMFALLGYSQGAAQTTAAVQQIPEDSDEFEAVKAIIVIGNPSRVPGLQGDVDDNGRQSGSTGVQAMMGGIPQYWDDAGKVLDICAAGDNICSGMGGGGGGMMRRLGAGHMTYPGSQWVQQAGADFMIKAFSGENDECSSDDDDDDEAEDDDDEECTSDGDEDDDDDEADDLGAIETSSTGHGAGRKGGSGMHREADVEDGDDEAGDLDDVKTSSKWQDAGHGRNGRTGTHRGKTKTFKKDRTELDSLEDSETAADEFEGRRTSPKWNDHGHRGKGSAGRHRGGSQPLSEDLSESSEAEDEDSDTEPESARSPARGSGRTRTTFQDMPVRGSQAQKSADKDDCPCKKGQGEMDGSETGSSASPASDEVLSTTDDDDAEEEESQTLDCPEPEDESSIEDETEGEDETEDEASPTDGHGTKDSHQAEERSTSAEARPNKRGTIPATTDVGKDGSTEFEEAAGQAVDVEGIVGKRTAPKKPKKAPRRKMRQAKVENSALLSETQGGTGSPNRHLRQKGMKRWTKRWSRF
ncbi:alpha/beta-hydrolase [Ceraceosorus guamensis]|uniref:Alpha/beta-hydrolase n=1 Tax=Ceraceosorus guamensis TaxID=1522189 RepID=A0A316W8S0_9BASI|nr:alpha/beta-hydrolase [Ceraceosorus guamensis]PWN45478.1 alpha/beta-hydrolase [Ceraceosorus guamensis]